MNRAIKGPERDCRQGKQVDCCDAVGMVAEKRPPALRRWPPTAAHIPSDCRLSDIEAELEQFTMNVWAPQSGFARLIWPMSVRSSADTFGLPIGLRDRQRQ